jgi:hypothetical protein
VKNSLFSPISRFPRIQSLLVLVFFLLVFQTSFAQPQSAAPPIPEAPSVVTTFDDWFSQTSGVTAAINGVACPSLSLCKGVGAIGTIVTWDGSAWSTETSGTVQPLFGVACPSTTLCKAVGPSGTILSWNGNDWSVITSSQILRGVACPSTMLCKAVGNGGAILSWNGSTWSADISGTVQTLRGIACPSTTLCKAVGDDGVILSWNGSAWSADTSVTTKILYSVACPSTTLCKAVGQAGTILSWNGSAWSADTSGTSVVLNGVSCPSITLCKTVGNSGTILSGEGSTWGQDASGTTNILGSIACPSTTLCKAVGDSGTILGMAQQTLTDVTLGFALDIVTDAGCLVTLSAQEFAMNHPNATEFQQTMRYWTLGSGSCTSGFTGSLTLPTIFIPDANDNVCRYTGTDWNCAANSFTASTITRDGITEFSDWAANNDTGPIIIYYNFLPYISHQ